MKKLIIALVTLTSYHAYADSFQCDKGDTALATCKILKTKKPSFAEQLFEKVLFCQSGPVNYIVAKDAGSADINAMPTTSTPRAGSTQYISQQSPFTYTFDVYTMSGAKRAGQFSLKSAKSAAVIAKMDCSL